MPLEATLTQWEGGKEMVEEGGEDGGQTPQPLFPEGTIWGTHYKAP